MAVKEANAAAEGPATIPRGIAQESGGELERESGRSTGAALETGKPALT